MEPVLPYVVSLLAAVLLAGGGFLLGARRGAAAREALRTDNLRLATQGGGGAGPDDESLREAIRGVLRPLVQREQLVLELSRLGAAGGTQRDLTALLDELVQKANFFAALLSDEQGWPVAASTGLREPDRLGATVSLLRLLADRIGRDGAPAPLSLMVHDAANVTTLCRLFSAGGQRLALTVVSAGRQLTPSAIDPALARLNGMLLGRELPAREPPVGDGEPG